MTLLIALLAIACPLVAIASMFLRTLGKPTLPEETDWWLIIAGLALNLLIR